MDNKLHDTMFVPATVGNRRAALFLLCAIVLGALMESIAGTALSFSRLDMPGELYTTPDEFAWLDCAYISAKIVGFFLVSWLFTIVSPVSCLRLVIGGMTVFCALMASGTDLGLLVLLRGLQGLCGAVLLVGGQSVLFQLFPRGQQPTIQFLYAIGAVIAPTSLAPPLQGWMVDTQSWTWIFACVVFIGIVALLLSLGARQVSLQKKPRQCLDLLGLGLLMIAVGCMTYVLQQGSRWNWFDEPHIVLLFAVGGGVSAVLLVLQIRFQNSDSLIQLAVFRSGDFCFGFAVSFVAGFALLGSSYLLPNFTLSVLGFTPAEAGGILLPSGLFFVFGAICAVILIQKYKVSPAATVPLGIALIMFSMWMLSGSTTESGTDTLMSALLVRGLGLGLMFLSIIMIALAGLQKQTITYGVAYFSAGRQTGGLIGVAILQTYIDRQSALNRSILTSHLNDGASLVVERLATLSQGLQAQGMEKADAVKAALALLKRAVESQVAVLSFNEAFFAILLVFVCAMPVMITLKTWLGRRKNQAGIFSRLNELR